MTTAENQLTALDKLRLDKVTILKRDGISLKRYLIDSAVDETVKRKIASLGF
jgi:hypothetical protein